MKNMYIFKKNNIIIYQYNHSVILKYNESFLEQLQKETNISIAQVENGECNLEILCYKLPLKENVFIDLRNNIVYPHYNKYNISIWKVINPSTFMPTVLISFIFK